MLVEDADAFVDDLHNAHYLVTVSEDGSREDAVGAPAGPLVQITIESLVLGGVGDVRELAVARDPADDTLARRYPYVAIPDTFADPRPQVAGHRIDQIHDHPLRIGEKTDSAHNALQNRLDTTLEGLGLRKLDELREMPEPAIGGGMPILILLIQQVRAPQSIRDDIHERRRDVGVTLEAVGQILVARAQQLHRLQRTHGRRANSVGEVSHLSHRLTGEDARQCRLVVFLVGAEDFEAAGSEHIQVGVSVVLGNQKLVRRRGYFLKHVAQLRKVVVR